MQRPSLYRALLEAGWTLAGVAVVVELDDNVVRGHILQPRYLAEFPTTFRRMSGLMTNRSIYAVSPSSSRPDDAAIIRNSISTISTWRSWREGLDLRSLKHLALNSLLHSAMDADEQKRATRRGSGAGVSSSGG